MLVSLTFLIGGISLLGIDSDQLPGGIARTRPCEIKPLCLLGMLMLFIDQFIKDVYATTRV
jgi:hypothetical protein